MAGINGLPAVVGATFNRPADVLDYAAGDLVANITGTAPQVTPLTFQVADLGNVNDVVVISRIRLKTNDAKFSGKAVNLHLFRSLPVLTVGDNGAFAAGLACTESDKLDMIALTFGTVASSDGWYKAYGVPTNTFIVTNTAQDLRCIYGLLETVSAIVAPGSAKTWTSTLEILGRR